ncbi:MAG TPA: IS4 family transposase [Herpetosiphonaceae bacterium]|nr:IS4 family transposase [Herpetosiphonaceae bacterium]
MPIIPQVSQAMQTLLTTTTEAVAAQIDYVKRADRAKFTPSTLVQTLVYGWLANPTASIGQLAHMAARVGVDVSPQAIDRRLTMTTATLLHHILAASMKFAIAADPVALPILQRFTSVRIHDSTTIGLPDALTTSYRGCGNERSCGTAGLKCGVQLDLLTGALCGLDLVDGRASDHALPIQQAAMLAGSLRLADLGFYNLGVFKALDQVGVYWLSRLQSHSRIRVPGRKEQSILEVVTALGDADQWESPVRVGQQHRLQARLLVQRVPAAVAAQRRARVEAEAQSKRRPVSRDALELAEWVAVITNVPSDTLSLAEAMVVLKIRWQIELLFKVWKSHSRVDEWRTKKPARILCEIYAKLIGLVVQQWLLAASAWTDAERSLFKAAQVVLAYAGDLASAHAHPAQFAQVVATLANVIRRLARLNKRQKRPSTAQRLRALTAEAG